MAQVFQTFAIDWEAGCAGDIFVGLLGSRWRVSSSRKAGGVSGVPTGDKPEHFLSRASSLS